MRLKAVIFDWAGTLIDPGCRAPVDAYLTVFHDMDLPLTEDMTRLGMGLPKIDHIRQMLAMPDIAAAFLALHGDAPTQAHERDIYTRVTEAMRGAVERNSSAIPGAAATMEWLRGQGVRIGSTTGYPRSVMDVVLPLARSQGIAPEITVCSDEADDPRPGGGQIRMCLAALGAPSPSFCLKVDDTPAGIAEGKAAGVMTLGVTATGNTPNFTGLSPQPDFTLPSIADLPSLAAQIDEMMAQRSP